MQWRRCAECSSGEHAAYTSACIDARAAGALGASACRVEELCRRLPAKLICNSWTKSFALNPDPLLDPDENTNPSPSPYLLSCESLF